MIRPVATAIALLLAGMTIAMALTVGESLEDGAQVWAAFGSLAAAVTALAIAIDGSSRQSRELSERQRAAAIFISPDLYRLRAILDVLSENRNMVMSDKAGYAGWLSTISEELNRFPDLLADEKIALARDLPAAELHTLVTQAEWLRAFRRRHCFAQGVTVEEVVRRFDGFYDELMTGRGLLLELTNRLFRLASPDHLAPWAEAAPSWAKPQLK